MLHLILGGCGCGKSTRLIQALSDAISAGKKTALLLPEQFSSEGEEKISSLLGTQRFNQVETYSFTRLAHEILTLAGSSRAGSYASDQEKLVYLYQAVQSCAKQGLLEVFGKRVSTTEFIMTLLQLVTKLRKAGVSGEQLLEASSRFPERLAQKTQDLAQILNEYDRILRLHERNDSLANLTEAARIVQEGDFLAERCFFIDEFDSFTGDQYQMLEVMLARCPELFITVRADEPGTLPSGIFVGGSTTVRRLTEQAQALFIGIETVYLPEYRRSLHPDLALTARQVLRPHRDSAVYLGHVHLAQAPDPSAEADFICAQICELLTQSGGELHCRDIAVAVKEPAVYNPILERAMARYGLPCHIAEAKSVLYTELIRFALSVMEIAASRSWQTDAILRYAKSPFSFVADDWASTLEHFCFTWSIDRDDWEKPFWTEEENGADLAGQFGGEHLERVRKSLIGTLISLRKSCRGHSVRDVCAAVYQHLSAARKVYAERFAEMSVAKQNEFVMTWNLLCDIFDTMAASGSNETVDLRQFYDTFLLLVQSCTFAVPPPTLDSITIADAQTARLDEPKILFVPGVLEGVLPGDVKPTGLFSQQDLRILEEQSISISRLLPELHSDEQMIVVKLLSAASEAVWLTYPLRDLDGNACVHSPVIDEIIGMFQEGAPILTDCSDLPLSFYVRTMASAYDTYVKHMHLDTGELSALREILMEDPVYAARLKHLTQHQETEPPKTSPAVMAGLLGEQMILSPSGIETFHQCAFAYFCQYVLRLYQPQQVTLSYQNIGNFAHYCLEQILRDTPIQEFLTLDKAALSRLISGYSAQFSKDNFPEAVLRSGRFRMNYGAAQLSLLELLTYMQETFRNEKFRPCGYEVKVTKEPKEQEYPALSLDGGKILCAGKIDRVDVYQEQQLRLMRVVDYKTGDKSLVPEKLAFGLDMQMLIYLFALEQSGAFDGAKPAGVLYLPSGQLKQNRYQDRAAEDRSRREILGDYYTARGLLTESAAPFVEQKIAQAAVPILQSGKDDALFAVNDAQMAHLRGHVEKTITQMAQKLRRGEIAPEPCRLPHANPCAYCTFSDICGKADLTEPRALKKEEKLAALTVVFEARKEDDDNAMD